MRTEFPSRIRQVSPSLRRGIVLTTAFQILDIFRVFGCVQIQSSILRGLMYFAYATLVHKLSEVRSCHPSLAANAFENKSSFLIPQPPQDFGLAIVSHLTHANSLPGFCPAHKNRLQICCKR